MTAQQLKNSILLMAVQGKLVPQDSNDEPASVLLERIHAEKERLIKEKKIKREKNPSVIFKGADNTPYEKNGDEVRPLADEVPFDIPDSWEWVRLGELFQHNTGKALNAANCTGQLKQYITTSNLYWDRFELNNLKEMYFSESEIEKCTVIKGDLLVCEGGDIGRASIWSYDYPMCIQNHIHRLRAYVPLCTRFFYYLFDLYKHIGWIGGKGIGIQGLSSNAIHSLLFPLPPLAEQHRIVETIDKLQPYTDAYADVESTLDTLNTTFPERLKKSILQEAVQGKLVPQDSSDEPAEALLERIRAEKQRLIKEGKIKKDKHESVIFRRDNSHYEKLDGMERCIDDELPFEIPESWAWVRWGAIAESIQYGYNAPAKQEGRIRMVRISDIHENTVAWSSVPFCDIDDSDIPTYLLQANDILFARTGGTVGKSFLVSEVPCESIYAGYLIRTRYSSLLCPQYLKYFMESPLYWQQLKSGTTATAQPNCNGQTLAKMLLPLPPANEQLRIVDNLARTFAIIERM
ncbi:restriction endonuclease subunit S [Flavonifractor plautii]|uniref:restriction endonuclease subunit S n=2 Tax=Flavonifractor plautii TaxID=292800 RepID=UPI00232D51F0|nr:restriction endonuclease subunit S [Flavonifractor plautii]MDB7893834.1 restriction endonuclease subunit S [Flavonifractor plautii]